MGHQIKTTIYPPEQLLSRLRELAIGERRSLNQQVLFMLEQYMAHLEFWPEADNTLPFSTYEEGKNSNGN